MPSPDPKMPLETTQEMAPPAPWADTPEFRSAVSAAVADIVPQLLAQLDAARAETGTPGTAGDRALVEQMALAIAQLTDQGSRYQRKVDPATLRTREEGREKMYAAILAARAEGRAPLYELRNKIYLDDQLVEPLWIDASHIQQPTRIEWPGIPNQAMRPANETAAGIFRLFEQWIGDGYQTHTEPELRATPGGMVITAGAAPTRPHDLGTPVVPRQSELKIRAGNAGPQPKLLNVLGTIAEPAYESGY